MRRFVTIFLLVTGSFMAHAENGYELWLRYKKIENPQRLHEYTSLISAITIKGESPTFKVIQRELERAITGLLEKSIVINAGNNPTGLIIGANKDLGINNVSISQKLTNLGKEGFVIVSGKYAPPNSILITANSDIGALYGVFHFLRLMQTNTSLKDLNIASAPTSKLRLLNHWDNLNRTVERGYAGFSIWKWHTLPGYIDNRYIDYARANASIGINGTVLTNVNANALLLTDAYLQKVKALADLFRPYGIKIYLTARFSTPIEIGGLKTADPLNTDVKTWWANKAKDIYSLIPDFGGFLVKANSEGQPGPQDYKRTHADGANMLADAVAPYGGVIIWRAFVYSHESPDDRHKQAYNEFVPLDGSFKKNVMIQVKNGAIDFMPREPFHPLFGAMPKTPLMMEFQITQEYLGQGTHLVYLAPLFKECLTSDTWAKGEASTVAKVVNGKLDDHELNGMAGVANIGTDVNWCGHPFAQANWYAFGRLCWNSDLSAGAIADEWLRMTFSNNSSFVNDTKSMMLASREIMVDYMNPLGLHHIMATNHHYGPGPWVNDLSRADWNPVYYHKADKTGIGFDRTITGSKAIAQYKPKAAQQWMDVKNMDEKYLLWFHHVAWSAKLKNGLPLWEALCRKYNTGVDSVAWMQKTWHNQKDKVDAERFTQVSMLLDIQHNEAIWWRDACLSYFQTFSGMPLPVGIPQPLHTLDYYKSLKFPFAPGINNTN